MLIYNRAEAQGENKMRTTTIKVTSEWFGTRFFKVTEVSEMNTKIEMVNANDELVSEFPLNWGRAYQDAIKNIEFLTSQVRGKMEVVR